MDNVIEFNQITAQYTQGMIEEIKRLFIEYSQSLGVDLDFQNFEKELNTLPGKYVPPAGALILALVDGRAAGCIALRKVDDDICEMKRLYVRNDYRGLGIGNKLISMIIEEASKLNYSYMRLDTLPTMRKAQELYKSYGFYDIEPYVYNPVIGIKFLELNLKEVQCLN
jgi:ribosomal protein S18 acetylase RimI-like enzyme